MHDRSAAMAPVSYTHLDVYKRQAGDSESFQTFADGSSALGSIGQAALDGDGGAQGVCPDSVIKEMCIRDRLHTFWMA